MPPSRRRNSIESAVVMKTVRIGESHRGVTLLTPERGIIFAAAYGAGRAVSKLKAVATPFAHVKAYIYHDPTRDTYKVTDVETLNIHGLIRTHLTKFFTASLWVEIILRSHGGGTDTDVVYELIVEALDILDSAERTDVGAISVQVLWRSLRNLGVNPNLEHCDACGRRLTFHEDLQLDATVGSYCRKCTAEYSASVLEPTVKIDSSSRRFLLTTADLPLLQAITKPFSTSERLRRGLQQLTQHALETQLNSIRCAAGIL